MTAVQRCLTGVMRARCKAKCDDFMKLIRQQFRESLHFATPPSTRFPAKRSLRNDCRNSILMTRRGTTNQKNYIDRGSDTSSVWNFCARFFRRHFEETSGGVAKSRLFSQAKIFYDNYFSVLY